VCGGKFARLVRHQHKLARQLTDVKELLSHDENFWSLFGGNQEWMYRDELQDVAEMLDVLA
jgi:uncharacterized protein (UPF0216 family)